MRKALTAVLWGFFGVRKKAEYEADTVRLKASHVIVAGLAGAIVLVLALFGLVKLVTH
jgi:hypothetical protein